MNQTSITAVVLTNNEGANISRSLEQLSWLGKILVVDSFSTDDTVELARAFPSVEVVQRKFDTHTAQWNFGLEQISTEWVLTLDADYEVSLELQAEMARLEPPADVVGYSAEFEYRIFGHSLRASSYPPRVVLFRVAKARYVDDGHTQTLWIKSASNGLRPPSYPGKPAASPTEETARIEKLAGKIYHDDRKPLSHWIGAQDRYATLEARHLREVERRKEKGESGMDLNFADRLRLKIFFAAPAMFLYLLFGRGLILDGWPGWFYVAQRTIAELLLSMRLLIEREKLDPPSREATARQESGKTDS